jgi:hypothetical protein
MADLYNSYSSAGDPAGGRDATKFYAFDAKTHSDAINANTHAQALSGARSALPTAASSNAGAHYFCTDCDAVYKSNGTAWSKIRVGSSGGSALADPPTSGWTAVNMLSGSSWAADLDGMLFTAGAAQTSFGYQYRAYPASPFTLTIHVETIYQTYRGLPTASLGTSILTGMLVSDGTKIILLGPMGVTAGAGAPWNVGTGWYTGAQQFSNGSTYSGTYNGEMVPLSYLGDTPRWYRFIDDGTNRNLQYSFNGLEWIQIASESRTTFLTPTRIGVGVTNTGGATALTRIRSWHGVS